MEKSCTKYEKLKFRREFRFKDCDEFEILLIKDKWHEIKKMKKFKTDSTP